MTNGFSQDELFNSVKIENNNLYFQVANTDFKKFSSVLQFNNYLEVNNSISESNKKDLVKDLVNAGLSFPKANYFLEQMRLAVINDRENATKLFNLFQLKK